MTCATPSPRFNFEKAVEFVCRWSIFKAHQRTHPTFSVIFKALVRCEIKTKPTLIRGEGVVKYAISRLGNDFCRDHCVLVMINHKSVSHIYGTPLVVWNGRNRSWYSREWHSFERVSNRGMSPSLRVTSARPPSQPPLELHVLFLRKPDASVKPF